MTSLLPARVKGKHPRRTAQRRFAEMVMCRYVYHQYPDKRHEDPRAVIEWSCQHDDHCVDTKLILASIMHSLVTVADEAQLAVIGEDHIRYLVDLAWCAHQAFLPGQGSRGELRQLAILTLDGYVGTEVADGPISKQWHLDTRVVAEAYRKAGSQ